MKTLSISRNLALPLAYVGQRNACLGMSGSGKSNASVVLAEEMHAAGAPWVAIDPKGDWYGVRSSRDGKGPGLDVPVIGGEFGDLPLHVDAGARLGELAATGKLRGVIDTSGFESNADQARFMTAFGRALLRHCKTPIHIFCDECDDYMPQPGAGGRLEGPAAECVGVWKLVARRGRQKGIGFTLSSQRTALVNKTCLYQCETLIAMRMVGKHDKAAIESWLAQIGDAKELLKSLPLLEDGEAWVWSPQRLKIMTRVRFRRRETFDSGRTPEVGETVVAPKLARVDIEALRAEMAAFDQENDEDDGGDADLLLEHNQRLRARVSELEEQLADERSQPKLPTELVTRIEDAAEKAHEAAGWLAAGARSLSASLFGQGRGAERMLAEPPLPGPVIQRDTKPAKTNGHAAPAASSSGLGRCAREILTALVQHGDLTLVQAAIIAGYASDSGGVRNAAGELRTAGLVEGSNAMMTATAKGRAEVANAPKLPTGRKLAEYWFGKLDRAERLILSEILAVFPQKLSLTEAAKRAGYEPSSGGVRNAAGKLRTLALVHGKNQGMTGDRRLV